MDTSTTMNEEVKGTYLTESLDKCTIEDDVDDNQKDAIVNLEVKLSARHYLRSDFRIQSNRLM